MPSTGNKGHMGDPKTEELQVEQARRERDDRERADEADEPSEQRTEERRADRAAYLREKLAERAESEDEAAGRRRP
jgi:hypothetical protein